MITPFFLCGLVDFIQLSGIKLVIVAFFRHEFFVGSGLQDAAVVNVHDPVTVADRGEARGDDKRSPSLKHGIESGLQGFFRLHVNAGGGFVEDQDGRIRKQRPGKGDKLLLSLTQHGAALPDLRIIPFRHPADELIGADDPAGLLDFLF